MRARRQLAKLTERSEIRRSARRRDHGSSATRLVELAACESARAWRVADSVEPALARSVRSTRVEPVRLDPATRSKRAWPLLLRLVFGLEFGGIPPRRLVRDFAQRGIARTHSFNRLTSKSIAKGARNAVADVELQV